MLRRKVKRQMEVTTEPDLFLPKVTLKTMQSSSQPICTGKGSRRPCDLLEVARFILRVDAHLLRINSF